jgi:protein-S-isoprenylcysteine O-methyltransferase Ste14
MNKKQGYHGHRHENREDLAGEYRWGDAGQLLFLIVFIIGIIFDILIFKISGSWQNIIPWYYRLLIFIPLFFVSGYFSQNGLKKIFKEQREKLEVIDTGVFGVVRHPIYLGSIILYLSFVVLSFSIVAFFIFIAIIMFYYYLCRYEEDLLLQKLGEKYKNYMNEIPMLFPGLKRRK